MNSIFFELTVVLITAGIISIVVSFFKQPTILAYLITGLLLGPLGYYRLQQGDIFDGLSQIGITLLLFMVGVELDITQLKRIGKTALLVGTTQVVLTTGLGFALLKSLNFNTSSALYLGIAATFSSTIIVVKLLSEKRDIQSLYGKLAMGILLVQDFAAILLLILLAGLSTHTTTFFGLGPIENILLTLIKALILGGVIYWHSVHVFPRILRFIGKSDELLLIFSLAWALGFAALVTLPIIGFSLEIGGFLAGIALANSAVHYQISARIKSLRDFFIIIFFIVLGSHLVFSNFLNLLIPAILLLLFVLVIKPLVVSLLLGFAGYKPRTSFFSALTLSQISEFSLILAALGLKIGHLTPQDAGLVTFLGISTIACSSYAVTHSDTLFRVFTPLLKLFSFRSNNVENEHSLLPLKNHIVLVGAHRLGTHIINTLQEMQKPFILVDFNPDIAHHYLAKGVPVICGDITDPHIQESANISKAKLIISTVPDIKDNLALVDSLRKNQGSAKLIVTAADEHEALQLYNLHIDYALIPHYIGALHLTKLLSEDHTTTHLKKLKNAHLRLMKETF